MFRLIRVVRQYSIEPKLFLTFTWNIYLFCMKAAIYFLTMFILLLISSLSRAQIYTWTQIGNDILGDTAGDYSGNDVAISGDGKTVAAGSYLHNSQGGQVRVFEWDSTAWLQKGLSLDAGKPAVRFGHSVALSQDGNILAVGIPNYYDSLGNEGQVRVFEWDSSAWVQMGAGIYGESGVGGSFGADVALSADGNTLAVGDYENMGNDTLSGSTRVFEWSGTAWVQKGQDLDGEAKNDYSGWAVAMSADGATVIIGATGNDGTGPEAGHARVYEWADTLWIQKGTDLDGESAGDFAGQSVTTDDSGNVVAFGARFNTGQFPGGGHVRVFYWSGTSWVQKGYDIDGEAVNDQSGWAIDLSGNGNIIAIGAMFNNSTAGHARVFFLDLSFNWNQLGAADIDGDSALDRLGGAVSLSDDGLHLAIGATENDDAGTDAGQVKVFQGSFIEFRNSDLIPFRVYPNPANGSIFCQRVVSGLAWYHIYDMNGKQVLFGKSSDEIIAIDMSDQPAGIYLLKLNDENTVRTARIIRY